MTAFSRLATPIHPTMDNAFMDSHFFSVPIRLVWDDFEEFMGETKTYTASGSARLDETPDFTAATPIPPTITSPAGGELEGTLSDYFGIPTKHAAIQFSAFWHRAYNLIWNDWFRDENLQKFAVVSTASGNDTTTNQLVLNRGKRHDYFTSALPWPQKGADVTLPLGTRANIHIEDGRYANVAVYSDTEAELRKMYAPSSDADLVTIDSPVGSSTSQLYADLTTATSATINQLRLAFATQKFLEKQARSGSRYIEVIKGHFNVTSPRS
jgi:hypothetical protein